MAVESWNSRIRKEGNVPFTFIVQLGDLIDGKCKAMHQSEEALTRALSIFDKSQCRSIAHLIGNHELYNFDRVSLGRFLGLGSPVWKSQIISPRGSPQRWRAILLDSYDICVMEGTNSFNSQAARALLKDNNPNDIFSEGVDWSLGLEGLNRRWMPYNGGLSEAQLSWLAETLAGAERSKERCLIFSHVPFYPGATDPRAVLWNYESVLQCIYSRSGVVVGCFYGHGHIGGYAQDSHGVHHFVVPSPLETEDTFCALKVFQDHLSVEGSGGCPSVRLAIHPVGS